MAFFTEKQKRNRTDVTANGPDLVYSQVCKWVPVLA